MHTRQAISGQNPRKHENNIYQMKDSYTYDHTTHNMMNTIKTNENNSPYL